MVCGMLKQHKKLLVIIYLLFAFANEDSLPVKNSVSPRRQRTIFDTGKYRKSSRIPEGRIDLQNKKMT